MRFAALLMILPGALSAQQLVFDIGATSQCVVADRGIECTGISASQCMEQSEGGYSTHGMSGCTDLELDWWDSRLNTIYGQLNSHLKALDAEAMDYAPSQADALKEMQRAWIPYRDAKCEFVATEWTGGTGAGPATIWCLMEETARQALYLEQRYAN